MADDRDPLDASTAREYERRFRDSAVLADLLDTAAIGLTAADFELENVSRLTGLRRAHPVVVRLEYEEPPVPDPEYPDFPLEDGRYVQAEGRYLDGELETARLQTGAGSDLLLGSGEFWQWEHGTIERGRWRS